MRDDLENIDDLFKQTFESFETDVNPKVWDGVKNSMGVEQVAGGGSTAAGSTNLTKIISTSFGLKLTGGLVVLSTVLIGGYFLLKEEVTKTLNVEANVNNKEEITSEDPFAEEGTNVKQELEIDSRNRETLVSETHVDENRASVSEVEQVVTHNESSGMKQPSHEVEASNKSKEEDRPKESGVTKDAIQMKEDPDDKSAEQVNEKPTLEISIKSSVLKGTVPLTVQFDALGNGVQYFWEFGDNTEVSNEESPSHTFTRDGVYMVQLTSIDNQGNSQITTKTITVEKNFNSSIAPIPNVFTPNGDGYNDFIKIEGENIGQLEVLIMNRRGEVVYVLNSLDEMWKGVDQNGNRLPSGQYYISGTALGEDGKQHTIKQAVNIIE